MPLVGRLHRVCLSSRSRDRAAVPVPRERKAGRVVAPGAVGARQRVARARGSRDRRQARCWTAAARLRLPLGRRWPVTDGPSHRRWRRSRSRGSCGRRRCRSAHRCSDHPRCRCSSRRSGRSLATGSQTLTGRRSSRRRSCVSVCPRLVVPEIAGRVLLDGGVASFSAICANWCAGLLDVRIGDLDVVVAGLSVRVVGGQLVLGWVLFVACEQTVGHHVLHPAVVAPVDVARSPGSRSWTGRCRRARSGAVRCRRSAGRWRSLGRTAWSCRRCWWRSPRSGSRCSGSRSAGWP